MPEKCRVVVCGFDPMLVKAYAAANARACWWHVSDQLFSEHQMKPKSKVEGRLLKVYSGKTGKEEAAPDEPFEWQCSNESGLAVVLPSEVIKKFKLTEFHFLEVSIEKIDGREVYPGEEKLSKKWWPDDRLKLGYALDYIA